jgi:hypothetical protein
MLESVALHDVVPKLHCINLLLLQNSSCEDGLHVKICAFYLINGWNKFVQFVS